MTLETALAAPTVRLFAAVKITAPFGTLNLLSESGEVTVDGDVYRSASTHGVLSDIDAFSDGVSAEAPRVRLTIDMADDGQVEDFLDRAFQTAPVLIYEGVLDSQTGLIVEEPEPAFIGEVDIVEVRVGRGKLSAEIDVASAFERFFDMEEGARLSSAWHESFWPGELGLDQVTGINRKLPWGVGGGGSGFKGNTSSDFDWLKGSPFTQQTVGKVFNPAKTFGIAHRIGSWFD